MQIWSCFAAMWSEVHLWASTLSVDVPLSSRSWVISTCPFCTATCIKLSLSEFLAFIEHPTSSRYSATLLLPPLQAWCNGVLKWESRASRTFENLVSCEWWAHTDSMFPLRQARWRGIIPFASLSITNEASWLINASTTLQYEEIDKILKLSLPQSWSMVKFYVYRRLQKVIPYSRKLLRE